MQISSRSVQWRGPNFRNFWNVVAAYIVAISALLFLICADATVVGATSSGGSPVID